MNVLFFGDPHFDSQTPIARMDSYRDESLKKLSSILDLARSNSVSNVFTTGDFFDKYEVSFSYLNDLVEILRKFKHHGINIWSLIGNHDLPYNNMSYFKNTPLSLLFRSGLVKHINEKNEFPEFDLYGIDYTNEGALDRFKLDRSRTNIIIMHYATENTVAGDSIPLDQLKGFDIVISGHDHAYYEPLKLETGTTIFRPGSLLRRTKEAYNLTRDILLVLYSTELNSSKEVVLPNVKPADEIFKNEVFVEDLFDINSNSYNEVFNKSFFKSDSSDMLDIIEELPPTILKESKDRVIKYLKDRGLIVNSK